MKRIENLFILHLYIVSSRLLDFVYSRVKLSTPWVIKLSYFNLPILGGMDYNIALKKAKQANNYEELLLKKE